MDNGDDDTAAPDKGTFRMQFTFGNVITWAILVATMGIMWGTTRSQIEVNAKINDQQDVVLAAVQSALADLRVEMATGNGDIRLMRMAIERLEGKRGTIE